jgi:hypothetical protein
MAEYREKEAYCAYLLETVREKKVVDEDNKSLAYLVFNHLRKLHEI